MFALTCLLEILELGKIRVGWKGGEFDLEAIEFILPSFETNIPTSDPLPTIEGGVR